MIGLSISSSLPTGTETTFSSDFQVLLSTYFICPIAEQSVELSAQVGEGEADSEEIGGGDEHHH